LQMRLSRLLSVLEDRAKFTSYDWINDAPRRTPAFLISDELTAKTIGQSARVNRETSVRVDPPNLPAPDPELSIASCEEAQRIITEASAGFELPEPILTAITESIPLATKPVFSTALHELTAAFGMDAENGLLHLFFDKAVAAPIDKLIDKWVVEIVKKVSSK